MATVIAYVLRGHGALRIPDSRTALATAALSAIAVLLSSLFLGEPGRTGHLAASIAVVAGIIVGNRGGGEVQRGRREVHAASR